VDYHKLDDNTLMRLMAGRREEALSELYDRYGRLVYSLCWNILGDQALAEEVTQDVFLRIWERADTYQASLGKVSTWLTSVARHRAIDVFRSRRKRPEGNLAGFAIDEALDIPAPEDVEEAAEGSRQRERVRRAMAQLPEAQRQALAYAYFLGYSHSQIAQALNEPLGTVKTRIRLAMQTLRKLLIEEAPWPDETAD
jgi:RNA polymerase sigma-70 factor (ECF subfamily)